MNFFVMVVQSPGYIFGYLILLAGFAAFAMCVRAASRADRTAARRALLWSLLPPAVGVVGALFGAAMWAFSGRVADDPARVWAQLGCTVLFGVFVAVVPALWAIVLLRRRPAALA